MLEAEDPLRPNSLLPVKPLPHDLCHGRDSLVLCWLRAASHFIHHQKFTFFLGKCPANFFLRAREQILGFAGQQILLQLWNITMLYLYMNSIKILTAMSNKNHCISWDMHKVYKTNNISLFDNCQHFFHSNLIFVVKNKRYRLTYF